MKMIGPFTMKRWIASGLSTALLLTAPGIPCYEAVAQEIRGGSIGQTPDASTFRVTEPGIAAQTLMAQEGRQHIDSKDARPAHIPFSQPKLDVRAAPKQPGT